MVGMGDGLAYSGGWNFLRMRRDDRGFSGWVYDSAALFLLFLEVEMWNKSNYPHQHVHLACGRLGCNQIQS